MSAAASARVLSHARITVGFGAPSFDEEMTEAERTHESEQDTWFRGLFSYAGVVIIDELFCDVSTLRNEPNARIGAMLQLDRLPAAMSGQYNALFAQSMLLSVASVSKKFAEGWSPASTLAEELALKLILDQMVLLAEAAEIPLDRHFRSDGADRLIEDADHEWLFTSKAGFLGEGAQDVRTWFEPFNEDRHVAPYTRIDLANETHSEH